MLLRMLRSVALMGENHKYYYHPPFKYHNRHAYFISPAVSPIFKFIFYSFLFLCLCFLIFKPTTPPTTSSFQQQSDSTDRGTTSSSSSRAVCNSNVSVYVYELPSKFNQALLDDCHHLNVYTDMCPHVSNGGLGQPLPLPLPLPPFQMEEEIPSSSSSSSSWYATHQFIAEMIFHARMEKHPCRTWEPQEGDSTLFYVPFYGGLHASSKFRETNLTERDSLAVELVEYVSQQSWWRRKQGRDHFLALGRTAWDFMRKDGLPDFGANSLLNLPQVNNMSVLTVERHPWQGHNQYGIPYPSYFHPSTFQELLTWQNRMRVMNRPYLFSFVGAPRVGVQKAAIRDIILQQCSDSTRCNLLKCGKGASKCHNPNYVLQVMSRSQFCMQAPGDSFTRRSTFDSVLTGCIPVFFSPHTAYTQYGWYLPSDATEYSVYMEEEKFIKEGKKIEEQLLKIPSDKVERMRRTVIGLIPRLTYMHPNATNLEWKDAVDIALAHLSNHLNP